VRFGQIRGRAVSDGKGVALSLPTQIEADCVPFSIIIEPVHLRSNRHMPNDNLLALHYYTVYLRFVPFFFEGSLL